MKYYLIIVWDDVEPQICGPYKTEKERDQMAKDHRSDDPDFSDGLYPLDIDDQDPDWDRKVSISSYSGIFFENNTKP